MKHSCHWLKTRNDLYHLEEIEQVDTKWILHDELKANEKWVYDDEASQIGQILHDHKIIINFCPYCGEKLNHTLKTWQTDFHKQHAPEPKYPEFPPENFFQCPEVEVFNTGSKEKWFIVRDPESVWILEKFTPATQEMVQMEEADYEGELCFLSGFNILFCPFCGELLDAKRVKRVGELAPR